MRGKSPLSKCEKEHSCEPLLGTQLRGEDCQQLPGADKENVRSLFVSHNGSKAIIQIKIHRPHIQSQIFTVETQIIDLWPHLSEEKLEPYIRMRCPSSTILLTLFFKS